MELLLGGLGIELLMGNKLLKVGDMLYKPIMEKPICMVVIMGFIMWYRM